MVEDRYSPYLTDFLNPREIQIVEDLANYYQLKFFVSSNLETEEYKRVIIAPDYYELSDDDFEIKRLEVSYARQFNTLTHPKVLGTLINQLGLERQVFGDIIINDDGRIQFSIASHLANYAIMTIKKIGNVSVTLISSGKVKLNYRQVEKADQLITIGDMISVRGFGRFRLAEQEGFSKSGKAKVTINSMLRRRKK